VPGGLEKTRLNALESFETPAASRRPRPTGC
jgi:hypothetical protein